MRSAGKLPKTAGNSSLRSKGPSPIKESHLDQRSTPRAAKSLRKRSQMRQNHLLPAVFVRGRGDAAGKVNSIDVQHEAGARPGARRAQQLTLAEVLSISRGIDQNCGKISCSVTWVICSPTSSRALSGRQFRWGTMDDEFCRERARTVRELAEQADPFIKKRLLQLAANYERRVGQPERADPDRADLLVCRAPIHPS